MGIYTMENIFTNLEQFKESDKVGDRGNAICEEREEGEIVDDFEFIISSDEEWNMRERIKQLEATNDELEKIARISGNYDNEYNYLATTGKNYGSFTGQERAARIPSDASSISSVEFVSPKKKAKHSKLKRKKTRTRVPTVKEHNTKHEGTRHQHYHHRTEYNNKNRNHLQSNRRRGGGGGSGGGGVDHSLETIHIDSIDSSSNEANCSDDDENFVLRLNRDELRFALARDLKKNAQPVGTLKERLQRNKGELDNEEYKISIDLVDDDDEIENDNHKKTVAVNKNEHTKIVDIQQQSDSSNSLEEQELRLIALKSAVLKKHFARKKRDAESAYSPTDFDDKLKTNVNVINLVENSVEDMQDLMEISPADSPHRPQDEGTVDTKPIDMDIETSESDYDVKSRPAFNNNWTTVERIPLPVDNVARSRNDVVPFDVMHFGLFRNDSPTKKLIKMEYDNVEPPPPPVLNLSPVQLDDHNSNNSYCLTNDDDIICNNQLCQATDIQTFSMENTLDGHPTDLAPPATAKCDSVDEDDDEDEEEKALRALLLSKFQSPKYKKARTDKQRKQYSTVDAQQSSNDFSDDKEDLDLLNSFPTKTNPTESILKEAVRRFQAKQNETFEDENSNDSNSNDKLSVEKLDNSTTIENVGNNDENTAANEQLIDISDKKNEIKIEHVEQQLSENIKNIVTSDTVKDKILSGNIRKETVQKNNTTIVCDINEKLTKLIETTNTHASEKIAIKPNNKDNADVAMKTNIKPTKTAKTTIKNLAPNSTPKDLKESKSTANISKETITKPVAIPNVKKKTITPTPIKIAAAPVQSIKQQPSTTPPHMFKIIKPNKVINKSNTLKRKLPTDNSEGSGKKSPKLDGQSSVVQKTTDKNDKTGSRLITNANLAKIKVQKLIINLTDTDTETDDDCSYACNRNVQPHDAQETLFLTLNNNYYDIASPISLPMESPCDSPLRSNTPCAEMLVSASSQQSVMKKTVNNDHFEKKIENFLKEARSKVQIEPPDISVISTPPKKKQLNDNSCTSEKKLATPVAVRHLPEASQQEYRRLIDRMKMLEKQKENGQMSTSPTPTSSAAQLQQMPLVKEVLIKNSAVKTNKPTVAKPSKPAVSKATTLRAYETSYLKSGSGILTNLNKYLRLVEQAKKTKIAKLEQEKRVNELQAELEKAKHKLKVETIKMSKVYPEIGSSNEILASLRQRRNKLYEAAMNLGKTIKGDDYRLNNDVKHEISLKSKKLALEIKLVNSINLKNLDKFQNQTIDESLNCDGETQKSTFDKSVKKVTNTNESMRSLCIATATAAAATKTTKTQTINLEMNKLQEKANEEQNKLTKVQNDEFTQQNEPNCDKKNVVGVVVVVDNMEEQTMSTAMLPPNESMINATTSIPIAVTAAATDEIHEENIANEDVIPATKIAHKYAAMMRDYISPLANFRNNKSDLDPNGILCPYGLMGCCLDHECQYVHLKQKEIIKK